MWYPVELVLSPKVPPLETSWKTSLLSGPGSLKKSVYSSPLPLGSQAVLGALTSVWWVQLLFINLASELLQREHEGHQLSLGWDEEGEVAGRSRGDVVWVSLAGGSWANVRKKRKDEQSSPVFLSMVIFPRLSGHHKHTDWPKVWKESKPQHCNLDNQGYMKKYGMISQGKPTRGKARLIYHGKWSSNSMVCQGERKEEQCNWCRKLRWESLAVMWGRHF